MAQPTPEATTRLLTRLSQKPGVRSTLILSRSTGAIVRASGLLSDVDPDSTNGEPTLDAPIPTTNGSQPDRDSAMIATNVDGMVKKSGKGDAQEVAKLVWSFFEHAGDTIDGMFGNETEGDGADEVKLVRLRTRKSEVVIVPDAKFLLCVIHDTPQA